MGGCVGVQKVGNMNPAFAKLLEYQEKAATFEPGKGGSSQAMGEIMAMIELPVTGTEAGTEA